MALALVVVFLVVYSLAISVIARVVFALISGDGFERWRVDLAWVIWMLFLIGSGVVGGTIAANFLRMIT